MLEALDYGDGVSNDVINKSKIIGDLGYKTAIYSKWFNKKVEKFHTPVNLFKPCKTDVVLFHFSGKSTMLDKMKYLDCKKVLVYHNITPPEFFGKYNSDQFKIYSQGCNEGLNQIRANIKYFDFYLADSEFNRRDLLEMGVRSVDVLPISIDFKKMKTYGKSEEITKRFQYRDVILFVGRVAPNKRHEDIIEVFEYYYNNISNKAVLVFVGNHSDYSEYYIELLSKIVNLNCKSDVFFTGQVGNTELYTYYQIAKAFVCMSEHEGFCIPLLESMNFEIPTIAYDSSAISATMGESGVIFYKKDYPTIAELINLVIKNGIVRKQITSKQNIWIKNFSEEEIKKKLDLLIRKWIG